MVDYILRMDKLDAEFPVLMKAFGLKASMPEHKRNVARNHTDLQAVHFDDKTEVIIHEKYGHDFDLVHGN